MAMHPRSIPAPLKPESSLFAGGKQPARRDFGISSVFVDNAAVPVKTADLIATPFCSLIEFARAGISSQPSLLVVAPISGHFAVLLRDLVVGLLPHFRVYVTDWLNVRHVPASHGDFGLEDNIAGVMDIMKRLPPGLIVIGLCQGGVPALAATAMLARDHDPRSPAALILIASPIDPMANPTGVVRLLRSRPLSWFKDNLITAVPKAYAGAGRAVYPAHLHLIPLMAYLTRCLGAGGEIAAKAMFDDGTDPRRFPFLDLFTSIMDLDAKFFLENTEAVFQRCLLREGALHFRGERVDAGAIRKTALLTIEGEVDDIAAPGQTSAAHRLCSAPPESFRQSLMVPRAGHFSLFHGQSCRKHVLPAIREFLKRRVADPDKNA